jgi:tetratricopeptide (TPR) repeat protein
VCKKNFSISIIFFALVFFLSPGASPAYDSRAAIYLARGISQADRGEDRVALESFMWAVILDPESVYLTEKLAAHLHRMGDHQTLVDVVEPLASRHESPKLMKLLGAAHENLMEYEYALDDYRAAYEQDPLDLENLERLCRLLDAAGKLEEAGAYLEAGLKHFPDSADMLFLSGKLSFQKGDLESAATYFKEVIDLFPLHNESHWYLGNISEERGDFESARSYFESLLVLRPDDPALLTALLRVLSKAEDFEKAIEYGERLLKKNPTNGALWGMTGILFYEAGHYEEAVKALEKAVAFGNSAYDVHLVLGQSHLESGNAEEALRQFDLTTKIDSTRIAGWLNKGLASLSLDKPEDALGSLDRAVAIDSSHVYIHYLKGLANSRMKRYDEALACFTRSLHMKPDDRDILFQSAATYDNLGMKDKAEEILIALLEDHPDDAAILNYLGYLWAEQAKNLEEAKNLVRKALLKEPENGYYLDSLAWVYYQLGNIDSALVEMRRSVERVDDDPVIFEHLGDIYRNLDEKGKAREAYKKSLNLDPSNERVKGKLEDLHGKRK